MAVPEIGGIQAEIERLVKDAYRQGYDACRADLLRFLEGIPMAHVQAPPQTETAKVYREAPGGGPGRNVAERRLHSGTAHSGQMTRGITNFLVEQIMEGFGTRAVSQLDIIREAERRDGTILAYTTLRRALEGLARAGKVEQVPGTKAWRFLGGGPHGSDNILRMSAKGDGAV